MNKLKKEVEKIFHGTLYNYQGLEDVVNDIRLTQGERDSIQNVFQELERKVLKAIQE